MISTSTKRTLFSDPSADLDVDAHRFTPGLAVWNGFLHEFRNHLTVLMAATTELRGEIPPALALRVGDAVFETERNVQGLTSLVALVDASVRAGDAVIAPLGDVIDRAVRLATPSAGRRARFVTQVPREVGVRNRGSALEGLLAALIVDLVKSHVGDAPDGARGRDVPSTRVRIDADVGRRGLAVEVACAGAQLEAPSWRRVLATELALKLDAALTVHPEDSAYVVQLR